MNWRDFLTDEERARLQAIPAERKALSVEYRTIFNRARKRMERGGTKKAQGNALENTPSNPRNSAECD